MHGAAMDAAAALDGTPMRMQPGKRRQQRGVDVHQAAGEAAHEIRAEDAHETGQQHQVGAGHGLQCGIGNHVDHAHAQRALSRGR